MPDHALTSLRPERHWLVFVDESGNSDPDAWIAAVVVASGSSLPPAPAGFHAISTGLSGPVLDPATARLWDDLDRRHDVGITSGSSGFEVNGTTGCSTFRAW
jgi:hypothetical protein